jgi:acyl dehydratase
MVSQQMIRQFADLTGDHQWIHLDEERCRRESPYGATIAHGFLVQSLIPGLLGDDPELLKGFSTGINYGSDKVRFMAPVRAGAKIRGISTIKDVSDAGNGAVRVTSAITIEIEGEEKPACYVEQVSLLYP